MSSSLTGHPFPIDAILDTFGSATGTAWQYNRLVNGKQELTYSFSVNANSLFRSIITGAVNELSKFLNVRFILQPDEPEVTASSNFPHAPFADDHADLRFSQQSDTTRAGGYAEYYFYNNPNSTDMGDIDSTVQIWTVNLYTILHEFGHALTLKHTSSNQLPNQGPFLPSNYQNNNYTVMHYYAEGNENSVLDQSNGEWLYQHFQLFDVYALQQRFGANMSSNGPDDYTAQSLQIDQWMQVLWDAGGIDTINMSDQTLSQQIDLRAGEFSSVGPIKRGAPAFPDNYNLSIAYGAQIENATGGSGNDSIRGNAVNNVLNGRDGNDSFDASDGGIDTLSGGAGDDNFSIGNQFTAADIVDGGTGNDQVGISGDYTGSNALVLGAATLTNVELLAALPGTGNRYSITLNDATTAAGSSFTVFGGNLGAGQNFTVNASAETNGNIVTYGGLGTDTITGGAGNDGFYFGPGKWQSGDTVVGGGGANDQLALDGSYTINIGANADVETLVLLAGPVGTPNSFNITLRDVWTASGATKIVFARQTTLGVTINGAAETSGNFIFFGGRASDTLTSGAGNDQIYGLEGNDAITGGAGSDTAIFQGLRASYSVVTGGGNVRIVDNDAATDGDDGTDTVVGIEFARFSDQAISITSPIILDLDGGGVTTLSAAQSNAAFDMDGDGIGDDTSWFGRGEGLLFLDRDGNGTLSNTGEMSFTGDVANARSDLEGLAAFDSNGDGQLSSRDARFREFKIWRDRDGDGVVDRGEVMSLNRAGVRSLNLTGTANNATTALGDVAIVNHGSFTRTNGRTGGLVDAVLTAVASSGKARATTALTDSVATSGTEFGGTGIGELLILAPSDDPFAALSRGANANNRTIDRGLLSGSFDDAVTQLSTAPALQRAMPAFTTTERDPGGDALATLPLTIVNDYGNWIDASLNANLDRRVLLMSQDMAAFGVTGGESSETNRLRRNEVRSIEMFAA